MSYQSRKGYRGERLVQVLLSERYARVCDRPRAGRPDDIGDVTGIPAVQSVKNHARLELSTWCDELLGMVAHAGLDHGAVWHHRKGKGNPLDWYVTMPGRLYLPVLDAYVLRKECP